MSEKDNRTRASLPATGKRRKKKKRKHPILFAIVLTVFCTCIAAALTGFIIGGYMLNYMNGFVEGDLAIDLDYYKSNQSETTIMYGKNSDGVAVELCRLHGEENRIWVDYDEMPDELIWSYVCLEDKRFFDHSGVDWIRTIGVMVGGFSQGGSTLTQQLIKNLTNDNEVTFVRKFNEILKALNMERYYSKKDIVEAYLNTLYLGAGCYGVKTAAETYFGKDVSELNLAECAIFAGLTRAPYTLSPFVNLDASLERQHYCLRMMLEQGKITKIQYDDAIAYKLVFVNRTASSNSSSNKEEEIQSYYEDYVITQVIADLQEKYEYDYNEAWRKVYYGGLKINAAVDIDAQNTLESIFENRKGFPSARKHSEDGSLPQCSMTVMDYNGRIIAIVGGTGEKTTNRSLNRAASVKAKRQPGSSIKPLTVYSPAIDMGIISSNSLILNSALNYHGKKWPKNVDGTYGSGQAVTVKYALAQSINTVSARIVYEMLGINSSFRYGNDVFHLGLDSSRDKDLAPLATGSLTYGVTTLEMAQAYACFGNGGRYYKAYSYYTVVDKDGTVILDNTKPTFEQAIKQSTATTMRSLMENVVATGTGKGAYVTGFATFGKTGSTSDYCDRWFCGGTPQYVASVWYGYDYPESLGSGSGNPAKTVFAYAMKRLHKGLPSKTFAELLAEQK